MLTMTLRSGAVSREIQTLVKKNMDAIGVHMDFHVTPFQDAIKEMEQGKFQIIFRGFGGSPSGYPELLQLYSKQPRRINSGLFKLAHTTRPPSSFCAARRRPRKSPPREPCPISREPTCRCCRRYSASRTTSCSHGCKGFSPPIFSTYWKYLDIDLDRRK